MSNWETVKIRQITEFHPSRDGFVYFPKTLKQRDIPMKRLIFAVVFSAFGATIAMAAAPPMIAGRITDSARAPVADVTVLAQQFAPTPDENPWHGTGPLRQLKTIFDGRFDRQPISIFVTRTDRDGKWLVPVEKAAFDYVVLAEKDGFTFGEADDSLNNDVRKSRFWVVPVRLDDGGAVKYDYINFAAFAKPMSRFPLPEIRFPLLPR